MSTVTKLFLSYGWKDDWAFVARLYRDLIKKGFDVWWDRKCMPSRALPLTQEIRDAVDSADRLIAVVGPAAIKSEYVQAEVADHATAIDILWDFVKLLSDSDKRALSAKNDLIFYVELSTCWC